MKLKRLCVYVIAGILAACEPQATPFPVEMPPTSAPSPTPGALLPLRYALDANMAGFVPDLPLIAGAQIEQLAERLSPQAVGTQYDVGVAYGEWAGLTRAAIIPHVALLINPSAPPLDQSALVEIVRQSINTDALAAALNIPGVIASPHTTAPIPTLRTQLANLGYLDGIVLYLAYAYLPGVSQIAGQLDSVNIRSEIRALTDAEIVTGFAQNWLHLALVRWSDAQQRAAWAALVGETQIIDLYILPISYQALPDLTITLSPGGFPIANR